MPRTHLHHDIALAQNSGVPVVELQVDLPFQYYAVVNGVSAVKPGVFGFEALTKPRQSAAKFQTGGHRIETGSGEKAVWRERHQQRAGAPRRRYDRYNLLRWVSGLIDDAGLWFGLPNQGGTETWGVGEGFGTDKRAVIKNERISGTVMTGHDAHCCHCMNASD